MRANQVAGAFVVACVACVSMNAASCSSSDDPASAVASGDAGDAGTTPAAPFTLTALDKAHIGSNGNLPDYHKALGEIALGSDAVADAKLVVDLASTCFPFEQWQANPPPSGQNWPSTCDAFDRNFEVALIDPANPDAPGIELVHAITPFGGPLHIETDVTDLLNVVHGKRQIQITIPSYSDGEGKVSGSNGGWNVSARIEVTPGAKPRNVLAVFPLVYDDKTKGATPRSFPFTLPEGTTYSRVEYLATGHGGDSTTDSACIGPADEFCKRAHTLSADGVPFLKDKELWRTDCKTLCTVTKGGPFGEYCLENPCGSQASVKASRANWCPGSETPPLTFEPAELTTPGEHTVELVVSKIAEGGLWTISAKVFAYGD